MRDTLKSIISPIASLIILVAGNGLFMTYVTVRLRLEDYSTLIIGIVSAAYYAGMFVGSLRSNRLIERIGHIRAFATFASLLAVLTLLQGFYISSWSWTILRFFNGITMAGLFITIESWLLVRSSVDSRGKILSLYMIALYAAQSGGQFLLNVSDPISWTPYILIAILTSLSVIPVSITRTTAPYSEEPSYLNVVQLFKISPLGVIGCFLSGIFLGCVYGLNPVYAQEIGLNIPGIALFMSLTIFGGLVLQWPLGSLSDYIDRRKVLLIAGLITAGLSIVIAWIGDLHVILLYSLIFLFGGFSFTLYPICISHACDHLEPKDFVAATGGLLLSYGIGAILGPIIAPFSMKFFGPKGLFFFFAAISGALSIYTLYRLTKAPPIPVEEKLPYSNIPRTTPAVGELDPRSDEPKNNE
ncbi:MAG: MFS transporter [Chlamydiae bacterium CG10_big_fil_rev_8_21_14_0_10_35_9]|nr:MAG: MFS transporter [Chlamydiae bacterium CG10_big_fil_rev_8_21_14_0_10_35_9]